jgi:tRNA A37 methylthiotransferase MiaB
MSLKTPEYQLNYFTDPFDKKAKIVFLNTCGFISSARDEADETVKKLLKARKTVYLMGCAVQYYKKLKAQSLKHKAVSQAIHYLSRGDLNTVNLKQILQ